MGQEKKPPRKTQDLPQSAEARVNARLPDFQKMSLEEIRAMFHELQVQQIELARQYAELRQTLARQEESAQRYRDFYDLAPVGFLALNQSGLIEEANLTAVRQLGVDRQRLLNQPFQFFIADDDVPAFRTYLHQVFQKEGHRLCEIGLRWPAGGEHYVLLDGLAVTAAGEKRLCRISITDLNELKRAEGQLQESQMLFNSFLLHLPSVAVIRDLEGRYLFANDAWEKTFHKTREEWLGKTTEELWPPEVAEKFRKQDRLVLETGKPLPSLGSLRHGDGLHHWTTYRFSIVDQDGQPIMIGINAIDITEHLEIKARLEQMLASCPVAIYTCESRDDFLVTYISENIAALVGWEPRQFLEDPHFWLNHVHPEDRPGLLERLALPWPQDQQSLEYRFLDRGGVYHWMHDELRLVRDQAGEPVKITGAWMDITAVKRRKILLKKERQRFFSLLDMLPALVCLVAPDHSLPFANRRFRETFGDPEGRTCYELCYGKQTPCDECNVREILETQQPMERERITPQGRTYQIYSYPFSDSDGSPMVLKLGMDITERKALEAQLLQAQKMEAVGRLAGGVAHDFNNLLTAIMGYGDLMRHSLPEATHCAITSKISSRLRTGPPPNPAVAGLQPPAGDAAPGDRPERGGRRPGEDAAAPDRRRHRPGHRCWPPIWATVKADPGQIEQVIMNLAVNARDAMPTGGTLTIDTANVDSGRDLCQQPRRRPAGTLCDAGGERYRRRHGRGDPAAHLRAVLHHQGAGQGHRPRPGHGVRHRQAERRLHRGLQRTRAGHDLQDLPAARRRAGGGPQRDDSGGKAGRLGNHPGGGR